MYYDNDELIINRGHNGRLTEEWLSKTGRVAYFDGGNRGEPGYEEALQWLDAILNDTEPYQGISARISVLGKSGRGETRTGAYGNHTPVGAGETEYCI